MKLLEKLKSIGINLPKLRDIKFFHISVNIDNSVHVDLKNSAVTIDPKRLSGKQRRALQHFLREEALPEYGAILHEKNLGTIETVRSELPGIHREMAALQSVIPPADVPLLQSCLYLRHRFQKNQPVEDLKAQIVHAYGPRGRNFANLCSADYLERWFKPVLDELNVAHPNDPATVKDKFLEFYNRILSELPWTEFVCVSTRQGKAAASIVAKINRNVQTGVRFLNVHGLGDANVKKIMAMLPEIEAATKAVPVKIEQDKARIFVRLEIPE